MGIYDRDYYRDEPPRGIHVAGQWSMVTKLIVINAAIYILDIFIGGDQSSFQKELMVASPATLTEPWRWWQLLSYGFAHSPENVGHIFWNMFALWVFGRDIEAIYGPKEFLRFYLVAVVAGGLLWAVRGLLTIPEPGWAGYQVLGASGAVTAVTLLFCIHYPKRTILLMFVLPVPAWVVGMMIIVGNVLGLMNPAERIAFDVHLVGAAFAICYYRFGWNIGRWLPSFPASKQWFKPRPKLKVHDSEEYYQDLDAEADVLLEKVKRDGIDSLSTRERRKLEDYSRRMRQKHG